MYLEPLFVRFANGRAGLLEVCKALAASKDQATVEIASKVLADPSMYSSQLSEFQTDFRNCVEDMLDNGLSKSVQGFLTSYTEPSLIEYSSGISYTNKGSTEQWVAIANQEAPWVEAVVCYNLMLFLKLGRIHELKKCKRCGLLFSGKGKHAVYCSDICKGTK